MAYKSKKLKLRKYKKGSTLPKKDGIVGDSYLNQNSEIYTPNSSQYSSLSANTQFNNPNSIGNNGGISNNINNNVNTESSTMTPSSTSSKYGVGINGIADYAALAGAAVNAIGNVDNGKLSTQENQDLLDQIGGVVGGVFYSGGKAADSLIFGKNENTGEYDSQFDAQASYFFTDPSQAIASGFANIQDGDIGTGISELLLPGLAGKNYQDDAEQAVVDQEKVAKKRVDNNKLEGINRNIIDYESAFKAKFGGKLSKLSNGGNTTSPIANDATVTQNTLRPQNLLNTRYNLEQDFGIDKNEFYKQYENNPNYLDSLSKASRTRYLEGDLPYQYKVGVDSAGNQVLDLLIPDSRTKRSMGGELEYMQNPNISSRPIVMKYGGQTHEGPDEGIEVDNTGIPSIMSGRAPVALTEKNEVAYKSGDMETAYIFSNKIKYKSKR